MSKTKERAVQLKEISKKFGYELKHTHALEIISHLDNNTNRHVALKNDKKKALSSMGLNFDEAPYGVNTPFYQGYVIEVTDRSEGFNFLVTEEPSLCLETLMEFSENIESLRFMTEEEVSKPGFSFTYEDADEPVPYKTLLEWINKRAKETREGTFLVVTNEDIK